MNKQEILNSALQAREQEIMHYQINIDNYTLALQEIDALPVTEKTELAEFRSLLAGLLTSEILEQKKAKIMLKVVAKQLGV